jgi:chemosensory pili system protein ChpA (sensor histidine kinase/response regulator)
MLTSHQADARADVAANAADLGPLAWVLDETRKSIESAGKSLKRFVHESEAARGVDIASVDASQLRLARQQLHQAVGALEMVGQSVAAEVVRAMEAAVQQLVLHPEECREASATTLERAGFALIEYLEGRLGLRARSALGLFPHFRQVQEIARADRIHPADLWEGTWRCRWLRSRWPTVPKCVAAWTSVC